MIEDLQDEYSLYTKDQKQPLKRGAVFLVMFIFWIIFATVIFFISRPKIRETLAQTNALEIVRDIRKYRILADSETETLYFWANGSVVPYRVLVKNTGATKYHNAVEGLLEGPLPEVLETGGVSFIKAGTHLIGLTVSEKTAFINFSQELATEQDYPIAYSQLLLTLKAINPYIEELVILVNGIDT